MANYLGGGVWLNELYHFNPNHDPKNGQFASKKGVSISGSKTEKTNKIKSNINKNSLKEAIGKVTRDNATSVVKRSRREKAQQLEKDIITHKSMVRQIAIAAPVFASYGAAAAAIMTGNPVLVGATLKAAFGSTATAAGAYAVNEIVTNSAYLAVDAKYLYK